MDIKNLIESPNIAEMLDDDRLVEIGADVKTGYDEDIASRSEWETRNAAAMELALQVVKEKTFPWPGASNVKFPLITIAALQFHARAYPALLPGDKIVNAMVLGDDPQGLLTAVAHRISNHMSFQLLQEDSDWEEHTDRSLLVVPILGCAFTKTYFDPVERRNMSSLVLPMDLVVNYWTETLDSSPRVTHRLYKSDNFVLERKRAGLYRDIEIPKIVGEQLAQEVARDKSQGVMLSGTVTTATPNELLEQHCWLDLDEDGYREPYIVTTTNTGLVLRIVARFTMQDVTMRHGEVLRIKPETYFTKRPFIPSPDGGFYDLGFGALLGPLNESMNTAINQLIDGGTMAVTAGGFLGRGVKMRGGEQSFRPWEWRRLDSTGDDLKKNVFPLPVREPSVVLLQLLELLLSYSERISGSVEALSGVQPGQNTPAETTRSARREGLRIFAGIFKRTHRALREEFRKWYRLNQTYLTVNSYYVDRDTGAATLVKPSDYQTPGLLIVPVANPYVSSDEEKLAQADALRQAAMVIPGYDIQEVNHRWLEALHVQGADKVYPGIGKVPPLPNPKLMLEQVKAQTQMMRMKAATHTALLKLAEQARLNEAKIIQLEAQAAMFLSQAKNADAGHELAKLNTEIGLARDLHTGLLETMKALDSLTGDTHDQAGMGGLGGPPGDAASPPASQALAAGNHGALGNAGAEPAGG